MASRSLSPSPSNCACNLLQQIWNLKALGAFLEAIQAARA